MLRDRPFEDNVVKRLIEKVGMIHYLVEGQELESRELLFTDTLPNGTTATVMYTPKVAGYQCMLRLGQNLFISHATRL